MNAPKRPQLSRRTSSTGKDAKTPALALTAYAHQLLTSPWHGRLSTRAQLPHRELAAVSSLALSYLQAGTRRRELDLALDQARDLTRDLVDVPDRDRAHAIDPVLAIAVDLTSALARDLPLDDVLANTLATALDLTGALNRARKSARAVEHAMNQAVDHARDLALALDRNYELNLEAALVHASDAADELDVAEALHLALGYGLEHGFDEPFAAALAEALDQLNEATTNVAGADLAAVDLEGIHLQGLHWSSTTQWPPGWEEPIRQASVRLAPDLYEIRDDPRIHSHLTQ